MPTFGDTLLLSKVAVAAGPATKVTPTGRPLVAVLLKPTRVAAVVPSKTLSPSGKTSICSVSAEPKVSTKFGE
jgi:hypothetical protein